MLPRLQQYCASLNIDCHLIDMSADTAEEDVLESGHKELCLKQIQRCQRLSLGSNFLVIKHYALFIAYP